MPTQPNPTATSSTFQVGTYTALTDTFTSVFDLNDGVTCAIQWNTLTMPQPRKAFVRSFNLRAPGERVTRFQYRNRHIQVMVSLRGSSVPASLATCRSLLAAIENPPYRLRLALPNATQYTYATVVAVNHTIPSDPQTLLAKALPDIQIDFECLPGLLGDRVTLQNLVVNPGFEAPSGPGVTAWSDTFANTNAYALQAGAAPTLSAATTYVDVVQADNPNRFYPGSEASGATAYDIGGTAVAGAYANVTLGAAGGIAGDTSTAGAYNGTTSDMTSAIGALPTGNALWSIECWAFPTARPASGNITLCCWGGTASKSGVALKMDSTGAVFCGTNQNDTTKSAAIPLNAWAHIVGTWDGTTLRCYVNGAQTGTLASTALTVATTNGFTIGANQGATGEFFTGRVMMAAAYTTALANTRVSAHYTAGNTGATGTQANTMSLPAAARVAFGSPAWGALNTWQTRFRWASGLTGTWYLHYTDANNHLRVDVSAAASGYAITHTIAGVAHVLASATVALTHEAWYWLQITQFPVQAGNAPYIQATLFYDDSGAVGSAVTSGAIGPAATFDGATALQGRPQIAASGAALVIGGAYANVHTLSLFGPGGWSFAGLNGAATGAATLAWEHGLEFSATTYPNGPVTSYGAARLDCPPAGTIDARLSTWDGTGGGTGAAQYGIPTAQNHVLGLSLAYKTTAGLSATSAVNLLILEYNSSGAQVGVTATKAILSGVAQTAWTAYSGTYTVLNAATAFVRLQLQVTDTTAGGSASASVWFDNVQVWDQTATGQATMPYCELRLPQSPAQLVVSGLLGDIPAPAFVALGTYLASWPAGGTLALLLGRRAGAHPAARLIRYPLQPFAPSATITLDSGSYGGYLTRSPAASTSAQSNMVYVWPNPGAAVGTYHLIERAQTSQSAGNLGNVSARLAAFEGVAGGIGTQANFFNGYVAGQLAASATWAQVDHGTLFAPIFTAASLGDLSQQYESCYGQWQDTTAGGSTFSFGVPWLLPVDADVLGATLINPTNGGALTAFWLWAYSDALGQNSGSGNGFAWGFSGEATALPVPAHSVGGPGTQTTGQPSINPSASPYLTLDPQAGANTGAPGVNQLVASLVDQSGALPPLHCEIQYTPIYLYPR